MEISININQRNNNKVLYGDFRATVIDHQVVWNAEFSFDVQMIVKKNGLVQSPQIQFSVKQVVLFYYRKMMAKDHCRIAPAELSSLNTRQDEIVINLLKLNDQTITTKN